MIPLKFQKYHFIFHFFVRFETFLFVLKHFVYIYIPARILRMLMTIHFQTELSNIFYFFSFRQHLMFSEESLCNTI